MDMSKSKLLVLNAAGSFGNMKPKRELGQLPTCHGAPLYTSQFTVLETWTRVFIITMTVWSDRRHY